MKKFKTSLELMDVNGILVQSKECRDCKIRKSLDEFDKSKKGLGLRDSRCKICKSNYYKENKEHFNLLNKQYREENKEYLSEQKKQYYKSNKERLLNYRKDWRESNKQKIYENDKKYREINKDKVFNNKRKWYLENKERYYEGRTIYRHQNKELIRTISAKRRAKINSLPSNLIEKELNRIYNKFDGACALTGSKENIQLDHVIPLSIGHGGTIFENLIPLRKDINISKSNKNIFVWFDENRERLNLSQDKFDKLIEWLSSINKMSKSEYRDYIYWCHENPVKLEG